ncbi:MAG: 50S ribosomal protein L29 [Chrysiogenetes bacterium]|nr:50S ribosomal protein L29 [Chrysiogenetes bacterium]
MKITEIRNLSDEELKQQLSDRVDELFRLRLRSATERIENTALYGNVRRTIARLKTVLNERSKPAQNQGATEA